MTDTPTGHDRIPDRYTGHGRETIDEMRDYLGDEAFAYHCEATAMKYWRRLGKKGDPADDLAKMTWYQRMAAHVRTGGQIPDPRAGRPGFQPYERRSVPDDVAAFLDAPPGELANVPVPKSPPDVPTVGAVESGFVWWQFGEDVVLVDVTPRGLRFWRPRCLGAEVVDPTDPRWLGPVTLRAVRS